MTVELEEYEAPRVTDLADAGSLGFDPLGDNNCLSGSGQGNSCGGGTD